jgi:tetratricopeptide (TPR) repeat protein
VLKSHLNEEQLEAFLLYGEHPIPEWTPGRVAEHLKNCATCREMLRVLEQAHQSFRSTNSDCQIAAEPNCPSTDVWVEVASGMRPSDAGVFLSHAANCDHCGPLLKAALSDVSDPLSVEEERIIGGLKTSQPDWQKRFAKELAAFSIGKENQKLRWTRLVLLLGSPAAVLFLIVWLSFFRSSGMSSPAELLARAYGENRTLELRIPGSEPSAMMLERGPVRSDISRNPTLLEAEGLIGKHLRQHPDDPYWLQMKGRAEVLGWNYNQALTSLSEARSLENDSPSLLNDLALAYFERAEATKRSEDYGQAIELLSVALDRDSSNGEVLFNRALIYEHMALYSQALNDWEKYLKLFPNGSWTSEARIARERVKTLLKRRQDSDSEPLLDPNALSAVLSDASQLVRADSRIEDYLALAIQRWLPAAFPVRPQIGTGQEGFRKTLKVLSEICQQHHHDHFLHDLLTGTSDSRFSSAVAHLSRAAIENHLGAHEEALKDARLSESQFRTINSDAGVLRAQFEMAYAYQRLFRADQCLVIAARVSKRSHEMDYRWLAAQSLIEEAFCNNEAGNIGGAAVKSRRAVALSSANGYHDSYLRAVVGQSITNWEAGSTTDGWNQAAVGLHVYWQGNGSRTRGTALFQVLDAIAEYDSLTHFQSAVIREYLPLLAESNDPVESLMTWF